MPLFPTHFFIPIPKFPKFILSNVIKFYINIFFSNLLKQKLAHRILELAQRKQKIHGKLVFKNMNEGGGLQNWWA